MTSIEFSPSSTRHRYPLLDFLRGFATFLMIIFHLAYDLNFFSIIKVDFQNNSFWYALPRLIVSLFLFTAGSGQFLAHTPRIQGFKAAKRFLRLALLALLITLVTYQLFPHSWIYFGTLHCLALSGLLVLPLIKFPLLSLLLALILLFPLTPVLSFPSPSFLPAQSMDYIPLQPWFALVLLGVFFASCLIERVKFSPFPGVGPFLKLGRHSLIIYLLHQPLLFSICWLISRQ